MQRLEVSGAVRHIYGSLGVKRLMSPFPSLLQKLSLYCNCLCVKFNSTFWGTENVADKNRSPFNLGKV